VRIVVFYDREHLEGRAGMNRESQLPPEELQAQPAGPFAQLITDAVDRIGSLRRAAAAVTEAAWDLDSKRTTVHASTVHGWRRGVIAQPSMRRWIAAALRIPLEDVTRAAKAQRALAKAAKVASLSLAAPLPYADARGLAVRVSSTDDGSINLTVKRREFLEALGGAVVTVGAGRVESETTAPAHPSTTELTRLFFGYGAGPRNSVDLGDLEARVKGAWQLWMTEPARYSVVGSTLPQLTADVEQAVRQFKTPQEESQRRRVHEIAAHHYFLLRSFFRANRRYDLATLTADRGILAAEATDNPLLIAAARWNLATVLLIDRYSGLGHEVAIEAARAIASLADMSAEAAAVYGALHLTAASAAVRNHQRDIGREHIWRYAEPVAQKTGETNLLWTLFGPQNVYVIAVGFEMEGGNTADALRIADRVDIQRLGSIERRATFLLEVARCYEQRGEDAGVLHYLLQAEREAPEDLQYHPLGQSLIGALLARARPSLRFEIETLATRTHAAGTASREQYGP
jgi:hypothetical protein